jgi:hypothetical protein
MFVDNNFNFLDLSSLRKESQRVTLQLGSRDFYPATMALQSVQNLLPNVVQDIVDDAPRLGGLASKICQGPCFPSYTAIITHCALQVLRFWGTPQASIGYMDLIPSLRPPCKGSVKWSVAGNLLLRNSRAYQFVVVTWDLLSKLDLANALIFLFRRAFSVEKTS